MRSLLAGRRNLIAATLLAAALHAAADTVRAQRPEVSARPLLNAVPVSTAAAPTPAGAFAIEAAGGIAGSMLGFGTIYLTSSRCDVEDLGCTLGAVFAGMVLGTAASAAGTWAAGRAAGTDPSLLGAGLGAVAGAAAGVGLWHLFTEELDVGNRKLAAALTYTVTQGVTTALGSRLLRRLSRRRVRRAHS